MEINNNTPMATICDSTRIQDTICETPNPLETTSTNKICRRSNARTNETPSNLRLSKTQQFYPSRTFQNGRSTGITRLNRKKRLHLQNRSKRCLRRNTNTSRFSRLSKLRKPRTVTERRPPSHLLFRRYLFARKDESKDEYPYHSRHSTPSEPRIHYKLQQEYTKSNEDTRIPWIPIQYQDDGDFSAQFKDQQFVEENTTSGDSPKEIMQMDCKFTGKDDSYDSGSGRRATSHKIHSEGLITSPTTIEPELGNDMQLVLYRPPRHRMVEDIHYEEEWVTHPKDKTDDTKGNHTRGCIEHRLGNQFSVGNNIRVLDDGRNATFNKRKRAQDDPVCDTTPRKRLCKLNYKDFLGQPNSLEVHDKVRRNSISITTGFSNQDTEFLQHTQHSRQLSTRTRYTEYGSRQIEQSQETPVRINNPETNVQTNHSPMGTATSGCLCSKTQSTITNILGTEPGPRSSCTGCISTRLASQWVVPLPTLETNSSSYTEDKTTATEENSSNHTTLAKSILVSNDIANETFETTNSMETEFKMVFSRMAVINDYRKENGIGQEAMEYLNQKIRQSTQRAYDNGWNHWVTWCISNKKDPCHYDPKDVLSFLLENQKYSSTHLNTLRSAIASVFTVIHPSAKPIADQPLIKDFFSAKRRSEVKIPSQQQLFTWDITILLQYIKTRLSPTKDITLQGLQVKTILLLCVATMWRPRSDIGQLQHRDINITQDQQGKYRAIIHARAPKESQDSTTIFRKNNYFTYNSTSRSYTLPHLFGQR
ncbi:hypothetical protein G6F37_007041 [Rhizopus arrhizus]|nr:hypothetical protein G6F38_007180 [Rhizopus arrhizus]KAG1157071.1 hypothetical protein G6F37_007041 [Rhizopus arrhizus]